MDKHGMDQDKLKRNLDSLFSGWVSTGHLPMAQALVIRNGHTVYEGEFGHLDATSSLADPAL